MIDIVKKAIVETNFYNTMQKSQTGVLLTFENLYLSKTDEIYLKKNHNLNSINEVLLYFHNEIFVEGDFFTASRTFKYSIVFLENSFKFFRIIETTGWDKEEDYFDEINYSAIEHVEVFEKFVRLFPYNSNDFFDLDVRYFGLDYFENKNPIEPFFEIILEKIKQDFEKGVEEGNKYHEDFWKEYENKNYEKALVISNDFETNYLANEWNFSNMSLEQKIIDAPSFWINKAQVLTMLGNNSQANQIYDYIINFEKNEENDYFINRAKIWKSKIQEDESDFYGALQNLSEGLPHSKRRDDYIYNEERVISLYKKYIDIFPQLPYKERKVIYITNSSEKFKSDNLTVLQSNNLPEISFPAHHPINNETYIGHPFNKSLYIPIQNYDNELLIDRINEFCYLLQCLGAESITIENITSEDNFKQINSQFDAKASISALKNGVDTDFFKNLNQSSENQISLRIGKNQIFSPKKYPYVPNDLTWISNEAGWQRLIKQRLEGNLLEHNEIISSSQIQILNTKEINDLKLDLKLFISKANINLNINLDEEIKNNSSTEWKVNVKFKPIDHFNESIEVEESFDLFSENENEFIEEYQFLIEEGELSERDLKILNRIRERLNISEDRARVLIDSLTSYTNEELELLKEIRFMLEDGIISEKEENILFRLANRLGVSNKRCLELISKESQIISNSI